MHECNGVMIMYYVVVVITIHFKKCKQKDFRICTLTLIVVLVLVILRIWQVQKKLIQNVSRFIKCDIWDQEIEDQNSITKAMNMALEYAMVTWPWQWTMTSKSKVPKYWKNGVFWFICKKYCILKQENCNPFSCQLLDLLPF